MSTNLTQAKFAAAAHNISQWLPDDGCEVAFAGRSNSGKSSALNAITGFKKLAITSKTPGRTQQIVFFEIRPQVRLVDLPGYGYAKVPKQLRDHWAQTIEHYFSERQSLHGLVLTMDIRHPFKALDQQLLVWCAAADVPAHILLTKSDKLSKGRAAAAFASAKKMIDPTQNATLQLFSSKTNIGVMEARQKILDLLSHS